MIYIVLFIYYVCLALLYDVGRYRKYWKLHFFVSLALMVLVSGLRYRIGSDTVVYMDDFKHYPDLFHLTWDDFAEVRYDPLWVLLNVCCKTFCGEFFLVQCVVSVIHISIWGKFVRKVCPTLSFSMVLFYYMFEYVRQNMELMREAVAFALFLLAILALNERKSWKVVLWVSLAFLFHKYSLIVFVLFYGFYKLFTLNKKYVFLVIAFFIIMPIVQRDWVYSLIGNLLSMDTIYTTEVLHYAASETYTLREYNWKGVVFGVFSLMAIYIFMNLKCRREYASFLRLDSKLFESTVYFSTILIGLKYSFMIIFRLYDYFQTFTSLLIIIFFMSVCGRFPARNRFLLYIVCLSIPVYFTIRRFQAPFELNPNAASYIRYYPYSSVLDPKQDRNRELLIFNYK